MKLATFCAAGRDDLAGVVLGDQVVDLSVVAPRLPRTVLGLVRGGRDVLAAAETKAREAAAQHDPAGGAGTSGVHQLDRVRLRAPIPDPPRLRDYVTFDLHVTGSGFDLPDVFDEMPLCYKGNHLAVGGADDVVPWPSYTDSLDFEAELGFYVSRQLRNATVEEAADAIAGVTLFNDFSARDIQLREMGMQLGPSKGKDFFNAIGPVLATMDEIDDEFDLTIDVLVDGDCWASGSSGGRRYSMAEVLAFASLGETVHPGEFFGLGTVSGGSGLELERWIQPGQQVELRCSPIGTLRNVVGPKEHVDAKVALARYRREPAGGRG